MQVAQNFCRVSDYDLLDMEAVTGLTKADDSSGDLAWVSWPGI